MVNVKRVRQVLCGNRRLTVRLTATPLHMKRVRVWKIIPEDLDMRKIYTKMVPRLLNDDQKERCMQACQDIIVRL